MSAIVGIIERQGEQVEPSALTRMLDAMASRGPDGRGIWHEDAIGLGHGLLHTTAASRRESQPLLSRDGRLALVWDGRLDNRPELEEALCGAGRIGETPTDPELFLQAFECWGVRCAERTIGDFACAIWDRQARRLWCARDVFGIKPFYYCWRGHRLLFASEIKALLTNPTMSAQPNEAMIVDYFLMRFRDPAATFFEGIHQLPPAHQAIVERGRLTSQRYWDLGPSPMNQEATPEAYAARFRALVHDAVSQRLSSAFPVAILLSGGIDSTAITAIAGSLRRSNPQCAPFDIETFSFLGEGLYVEESEAMERIHQAYGLPHQDVRQEGQAEPLSFARLFFRPETETAMRAAWPILPELLSPIAARGCRVVLTGVGANELFYPAEVGYLHDLLWSGRLRQFLQASRRYWATYTPEHPYSLWRMVRPLIVKRWPTSLHHLLKRARVKRLTRWVDRAFATRARLAQWRMPTLPVYFPTQCQQAVYEELTQPLMSLSLNHLDAQASRFGLEYRHPFLDRRLVETLVAMPPQVKFANGFRKAFLQTSLAPFIPGPMRLLENHAEMIPSWNGPGHHQEDARALSTELNRADALVFRYLDRQHIMQMLTRYREGRLPLEEASLLWAAMTLEWWLQHWFGRGATP